MMPLVFLLSAACLLLIYGIIALFDPITAVGLVADTALHFTALSPAADRKRRAVSGSLEKAAAVAEWRRAMVAVLALRIGFLAIAVINDGLAVTWSLLTVLWILDYLRDEDGGNPFKCLGRKIKNRIAQLGPQIAPSLSPA